uniref:MOSC domain-containing protein n=1 Tax=Chromera velia CCMP2878 TaxID=1169474 RepID=A0A0G4G3C6_9ALVE|eukprot:Cvel_19958.t1-p1 / transcript=Cvel_19958.t1 / gene=Cvel_19958 / organism=Chromera_velia_CCMP2878 / gene_product=MOSC domain-containing protein 1, mitochondrial, putative / transcript_product=MOSC domain-containing protein 1, mitochondrial, putative / location=Cvel_scaffold1757:14159-15920(-) / protein_length=425 / sequence_SO=supercontig / SO=protein_coding / is_pseudo=false
MDSSFSITVGVIAVFTLFWGVFIAFLFFDAARKKLPPVGHRVAQVSKLYVYPIKGARGIELSCAVLSKYGIYLDRFWMVAKARNNQFVTQRCHSMMAQVKVQLEDKAHKCIGSDEQAGDGEAVWKQAAYLRVTHSTLDLPPLVVSIPGRGETATSSSSEKVLTTKVWNDDVQCVDEGDEAGEWFTKALNAKEPLRLFRTAPSSQFLRTIPERFARRAGETVKASDNTAALADGFPFLIVSENAMQALNARLPSSVGPMNLDRFRGNVVVSIDAPTKGQALTGTPFLELPARTGVAGAFHEDTWGRIAIGRGASKGGKEIVLASAKPCTRCTVPTLDQKTGERAPNNEPTRTLRDVLGRGSRYVKEKEGQWSIFFGQNMVQIPPSQRGRLPAAFDEAWGTLRVADEVRILKWQRAELVAHMNAGLN